VSTLNALRIATWNLDRPTAAQKRECLMAWIRKVNADVWVFTETHSEMKPAEDFHPAVSTTKSDRPGDPGESWTAIWSRFPITGLGVSSDPARAVAARVEPSGRHPIVVYGAVLPWLGSAWGIVPADNGAAFAAALEAQARDWKSLQAHHPDCDFIVAGDLNQDLVVEDLHQDLAEKHFYGSHANRAALTLAIKDAALTCLTRGLDDPVRLGGAREHATIDHICVSARLAAQARWPRFAWPPGPVPTKALTDHFGAGADFQDT
jgi:exonuclease III